MTDSPFQREAEKPKTGDDAGDDENMLGWLAAAFGTAIVVGSAACIGYKIGREAAKRQALRETPPTPPEKERIIDADFKVTR